MVFTVWMHTVRLATTSIFACPSLLRLCDSYQVFCCLQGANLTFHWKNRWLLSLSDSVWSRVLKIPAKKKSTILVFLVEDSCCSQTFYKIDLKVVILWNKIRLIQFLVLLPNDLPLYYRIFKRFMQRKSSEQIQTDCWSHQDWLQLFVVTSPYFGELGRRGFLVMMSKVNENFFMISWMITPPPMLLSLGLEIWSAFTIASHERNKMKIVMAFDTDDHELIDTKSKMVFRFTSLH